tara:strand:+ start:5919 stop:6173 length:255 start_codon:yes stop_codon:yes gene_type:complete
MSRCKSCNRILDNSELRYRHKETGGHDEFCTKCRNLSYDTRVEHEYHFGLETESLVNRIESEGVLRIEELPTFNDKPIEDLKNE